MAKCPQCDELLINPRQCECGWKAQGAIEKAASQCDAPGCSNHYSVRMQNGQQYCSACLAKVDEVDVDRDGVNRLRVQLHKVLNSWKSGIRRPRRGRVRTPATEEMHDRIDEHFEAIERAKHEELVQEEPGSAG